MAARLCASALSRRRESGSSGVRSGPASSASRTPGPWRSAATTTIGAGFLGEKAAAFVESRVASSRSRRATPTGGATVHTLTRSEMRSPDAWFRSAPFCFCRGA